MLSLHPGVHRSSHPSGCPQLETTRSHAAGVTTTRWTAIAPPSRQEPPWSSLTPSPSPEARSYLAALADQALTSHATVEYGRVLLHLDVLHCDRIPAISPVPSYCRGVLFDLAHAAIAELDQHGVDLLSVELLLDGLQTARFEDLP